MQEIIQTQLQTLEEKFSVKILFACESGSRAWGFPSPDSDYDVRFIYMHNKAWYLSLEEGKDTIDIPVNDVLDINGWDLRKSLRLAMKSNAVIYEWMQSPIIYCEKNDFRALFQQIAPSNFSPIAAIHHYLSMGRKKQAECLAEPNVKLKRYFYALRATLAALWIAEYKAIPPMELKHLMVLINDTTLVAKIESLITLKSTCDESHLHTHELELELFIEKTLTHCELVAQSLPSSNRDNEQINDLFRSMLHQ
jgi:uncharacterized protein